ncbi:hypothetical protein CUU62_19265 [Pseudomonas sp. WP001]|nr:hypothetical protein CUU62_19265 [Pseudomonas sp. WP001]
MLAKNVNDNAVSLVYRVAFTFFASKLAPTVWRHSRPSVTPLQNPTVPSSLSGLRLFLQWANPGVRDGIRCALENSCPLDQL